jgi:hypothetical protein
MCDRMPNRLCCENPYRPAADQEVVEVPLLLPGWQVSVLETAAHDRGLTAGQMVRSLLRDFLAGLDPAAPGGPTLRPRRADAL